MQGTAKIGEFWLNRGADFFHVTRAMSPRQGGEASHRRRLLRCYDGRPVFMQSYSGKKEGCELPVAQKRLAENAGFLPNAVIAGYARYCQKNGLPDG